ncbi:hypothetical protein K458DRAFT_314791, partial [Lentithecium fluviatile CBS 122367]
QEAQDNTITLHGDCPALVKLMNFYLYDLDYMLSVNAASHLLMHIEVFALADKYAISTLQILCADKFKKCVHFHSDSDEFVAAISYIFGELTKYYRKMREEVATLICSKMSLMIKEIHALGVYGKHSELVLLEKGKEMKWWT